MSTEHETWLDQFERFTPEEMTWWMDELIKNPTAYSCSELVMALAMVVKRQREEAASANKLDRHTEFAFIKAADRRFAAHKCLRDLERNKWPGLTVVGEAMNEIDDADAHYEACRSELNARVARRCGDGR